MDAVLFDLDGTLLDTTSAVLASLQYTFWHFTGEKRSLDGFRQYLGMPLDDALLEMLPAHAEAARDIYVQHNLGIHEETVKPFPGAVPTLRELKANGIRIAIVTSKRRHSAQVGLGIAGLVGFFDAEVYFEDTPRHKPDAEPIVKALGLLGISEGRVLMVGDSPYDVRAAKNAAIELQRVDVKSAGAAYGPFGRDALSRERPDFIIDRIEDVLAICKIPPRKAT